MTSRNVVVASDRRLVFVQDDGTGEPRSVDIMPGDLEAILNDLPDIIITDRVPAAVAFMCGAAAERGANVAFVPSHDMSRKIFEENKRSFTLNGRINQQQAIASVALRTLAEEAQGSTAPGADRQRPVHPLEQELKQYIGSLKEKRKNTGRPVQPQPK